MKASAERIYNPSPSPSSRIFDCTFGGPTKTHTAEPLSDSPRNTTVNNGIRNNQVVWSGSAIEYLLRRTLQSAIRPTIRLSWTISKRGGKRLSLRILSSSHPPESNTTNSGLRIRFLKDHAHRLGSVPNRHCETPSSLTIAPGASESNSIRE